VKRLIGVLVATCAYALLGAPASAAQSVTIRVVRTDDGKPVGTAALLLIGNEPRSASTDSEGIAAITDVPPGVYVLRITALGFVALDQKLQIGEASQRLEVTLRPLQTIGRVHASRPVLVESPDTERKISANLLEALSRLAGVDVLTDSNGSTSGLSLRNQNASDTGILVDGVRQGTRVAQQTMQIASDLFTSASVDFSEVAGASAGTVNFRTAEPTAKSRAQFVLSADDLGGTSYGLTATGTGGRVGYAVQHSFRGAVPLSEGAIYPDQSGLTYQRDGASRTIADLIKVRIPVTRRSALTIYNISGSDTRSVACYTWLTTLPCGYGPGNSINSSISTTGLRLAAQAGNVALSLAAYHSTTTTIDDERARKANLRAVPYYFKSNTDADGLTFLGSAASGRHSLSLSLSAERERNVGKSLETVLPGSDILLTSLALQASDRWRIKDRATLELSASYASRNDIGSALWWSTGVEQRVTDGNVVRARLSVGTTSPVTRVNQPLVDPSAALYDCRARAVYITGRNDVAGSGHSVSIDVSDQQKWRAGSVGVSVYNKVLANQSMPLAAPISSNDVAELGSYINELRAYWSSNDVCGSASFDPARVYSNRLVDGLAVRYGGISVSGQFRIGRKALLVGSGSIASAYLTSLNPQLELPQSFIKTNVQIPLRPLKTASLTFDTRAGAHTAEWLINAQYWSENNQWNQPAGVTLALAGVFPLARGTLTVSATNVTNRGSADGFIRDYGVNPFAMRGGGVITLPTNPLAPRKIVARFAIGTGPK
jgi:hypothetical protein